MGVDYQLMGQCYHSLQLQGPNPEVFTIFVVKISALTTFQT